MLTAVLLLALAGAGCSARMKASYHESRADRFFAAGRFDQAAIEYQNVLRNSPKNARAWTRLGLIYFDQGRLMESAQILNRARQLAPNDLEVRLKLGTICLEFGQLEEAQNEAGFVLDKNPADALAPILLAEAVATNQIDATRVRLQKLSPPGGTAPLEVALGGLSLRQGDLPAAQAAFQRAVSLDPKFSEAWSALGNVYLVKNDRKSAGDAFKTAAGLAPPRSGKALQYARFKILTGDSAAGKQVLQELLQKAPDYLPAWLALAELAAAEKKYADGTALLGNVLGRDPQNLQALLLRGRIALQAGDSTQAINDFEAMTKMFPKLPVVYYQLGLARLASGDTDKAMAGLNQAISLNPQYADAVQSLAEIQMRNGNLAPAITALQQLIQQSPSLVSARLLLAEAWRIQGGVSRAVQIYRDLETTAPQNPRFHLLMGTALLQQSNNSAARLEFDQALRLAPDYLEALEQMVNLDLTEKQFATAEQRVEQRIAQDPAVPALKLLLAGVQIARNETNQAEGTLLHAIQSQPDDRQAYLMLAQLYSSANENQKALADLQTDLAGNPKDTRAMLLMGMTYEAMKDYKNAGDIYEKLLLLSPNNGVALNNLACLCAEHLGQLDQGWRLAVKARDLVPRDPSIADTLGWILFQKGHYYPALDLLRQSVFKLYAVPEVQYHLGQTYYMLGDEAEARAAFQQALQLNQDFPARDECRQCLAVLAIDAATAGADQRAWLEKRVAAQPRDAVALMRLAAICQREGAVDKAMAACQAALQATPQNVQAMVNLARLYEPVDLPKAFTLAKAAYDLNPNDPQVSHTMGWLALLSGDPQWALNLLQLTDRIQPQNPEVLYDLAQACYSMDRLAEAVAAMRAALQTGTPFSRSADARRFLAMADFLDQAAPAPTAQAQIDDLLKSTPDYVPALMAKAFLAGQKPDPAAAAQIYQELLARHPDFIPAQKRLAFLYARMPDRRDQAYALAVKVRQALPDDSALAKTLGILTYLRGDFPRASDLLQESVRQRKSDAELLYYLGMAQYHQNNRAESRSSLQRALDLNLSGDEALEARKTLTELK
jgi:tetratricopeptide (TPR) repeat protein